MNGLGHSLSSGLGLHIHRDAVFRFRFLCYCNPPSFPASRRFLSFGIGIGSDRLGQDFLGDLQALTRRSVALPIALERHSLHLLQIPENVVVRLRVEPNRREPSPDVLPQLRGGIRKLSEGEFVAVEEYHVRDHHELDGGDFLVVQRLGQSGVVGEGEQKSGRRVDVPLQLWRYRRCLVVGQPCLDFGCRRLGLFAINEVNDLRHTQKVASPRFTPGNVSFEPLGRCKQILHAANQGGHWPGDGLQAFGWCECYAKLDTAEDFAFLVLSEVVVLDAGDLGVAETGLELPGEDGPRSGSAGSADVPEFALGDRILVWVDVLGNEKGNEQGGRTHNLLGRQ